jgi:hypothetical protein
LPGTIVILGWARPLDRGTPEEYAVVGYSRATIEPLAGRNGRTFFVLHNRDRGRSHGWPAATI